MTIVKNWASESPVLHELPLLVSFTLLLSFCSVVGWYAQSDWPAADGQAPGRVVLCPFLIIGGPHRSVFQTGSPDLRPGQETFLFFQKELSPFGLSASTVNRWRQMRGKEWAKEWQQTRSAAYFALSLPIPPRITGNI